MTVMPNQQQFEQTGGRRADRRSYRATVQFRSGNRRANVEIRDISELGARVMGVFLVREEDRFFLKIGTIEAIEARVAWVSDFEFGCEFLRPLNPIILDAITRSA